MPKGKKEEGKGPSSESAKGRGDESPSIFQPITLIVLLLALLVGVCFHSWQTWEADRTARLIRAQGKQGHQQPKFDFPVLPDLTSSPLLSEDKLQIVAELPFPPGNIAVSESDRILFTFHPMGNPKTKVAEWDPKQNTYFPYPSKEYQSVENGGFHSILSIRIDGKNRLWVLDFADSGKGQPALFAFDLSNDQLIYKYDFPKELVGVGSMLNDLQISPDSKTIYIADTSIEADSPAILIFDTETKTSRKVLYKHSSVLADPFSFVIYGKPFPPDVAVHIHVDSIGLDKSGEYLYYGACNKQHLFRVKTSDLLNENLTPEELGSKVERFAKKTSSDGITIDTKGNIFLTDFEHSAITVINQKKEISTLVRSDKFLRWPDGLGFDKAGNLYITASFVHGLFAGADLEPERPFHILKIHPKFTKDPQVPGQ